MLLLYDLIVLSDINCFCLFALGMFDTSASEGETVDESIRLPVAKKTFDKSQNVVDEPNTQMSRRRRLYSKESIPKFSISIEDDRSP